LLALTLRAHDTITTKLTFTRDVSRIFARRCMGCHGAEASIPLLTYEQARPWAVAIKEQVLSRQMPPWGAVKGFGNLSPDNGLSQEEILLIAAWVVGGAPKGNLSLAPEVMSPLVAPLPQTKDLLVVQSKATLKAPLIIAGVRPMSKQIVDSARIVVTFPDGHTEPLVWLYRYDPAWQQTFRFRSPMTLPAGSVVDAGSPLQFALISR
jgi:hypothetical protein